MSVCHAARVIVLRKRMRTDTRQFHQRRENALLSYWAIYRGGRELARRQCALAVAERSRLQDLVLRWIILIYVRYTGERYSVQRGAMVGCQVMGYTRYKHRAPKYE